MILFRVIPKNNENILNEEWSGVNTFNYEQDKEYIHFFILPENAEVFQLLKYKNNQIESIILKCDIPFYLLKDNFGAGMYRYYYPHKRTPFLEAKIQRQLFDKNFIVDTSEKIKDEWKNTEIFNRFMFHCVSSHTDKTIPPILFNTNVLEESKPNLNPNFNFLHYFTKQQLIKENIQIEKYPEPIPENEIQYYKNYNRTPKELKSERKNILISLRDFLKKNTVDEGKKIKNYNITLK